VTARVLPPSEYDRLPPEAGLERGLALVDPALQRVIVVEDGGAIIGTWAVLLVPHLEGVWIHPDYRKRPGVVRRLLQHTFAVARVWGAWAWTGATQPDVRALLVDHLKARVVPGESFIVPMGKG
jgi:hypothetical protein